MGWPGLFFPKLEVPEELEAGGVQLLRKTMVKVMRAKGRNLATWAARRLQIYRVRPPTMARQHWNMIETAKEMDWAELDGMSEEWKREAERGVDLQRRKKYWRGCA
jgi:hypothetical protein